MPDDLRTRIAAVIRREVPCHPPAADRIADVLIRELGLLPADTKEPYGCQRCDCSCCYGYEDCHCVTDPCNCGSTKREHGR